MSTLTVDVAIPDGFELTGEYRPPSRGEWYLGHDDEVKRSSGDIGCRWPIVRNLEPPTLPEGYEHVDGGTYRKPIKGESFLTWQGASVRENYDGNPSLYFPPQARDGKRWIVRKSWQAPAWMPEGHWLYKSAGFWYISEDEPVRCFGCWGANSVVCNVRSRLVVEPPANKILIKH